MNPLMHEFIHIHATNDIKKIDMSIIMGDLSPSEMGILRAIYSLKKKNEGKNITVSDIMTFLSCSAPNISRTIKSLESGGYVERVTNKENRRETFVVITEKGKKAFNDSNEKMMKIFNSVSEKIGEEKLKRFSDLKVEIMNAFVEEIEDMKQNTSKENKE